MPSNPATTASVVVLFSVWNRLARATFLYSPAIQIRPKLDCLAAHGGRSFDCRKGLVCNTPWILAQPGDTAMLV